MKKQEKTLAAVIMEVLDDQKVATNIDPGAADNPRTLSKELVRLPGDLAYHNGVYADILEYQREAKRTRDRVEAQRQQFHRENAAPPPSGRVTESFIQSLVETDPLVITAQEDYDRAEVWRVRLAGIIDAIRAKKELLTSIGILMQAEIRSHHLAGTGDPQREQHDSEPARERRAGLRE
jgi:hypothetical protein